MKDRWTHFVELVKGAAIFAVLLLFAPFIAAWLGVEHVRQRPLVQRLSRDRVDDLRVVAEDLAITRAGEIERVPLADLTGGEWTLVDYGGAFADANECGLLLDFQRAGGEQLRLALQYYEAYHFRDLIEPLNERGLLPREAHQDNITGSFLISMVALALAGWILVALVVALIWSGWLR